MRPPGRMSVLLGAAVGLVFLAQYWIPHPASQAVLGQASRAAVIAGALIVLLGAWSFLGRHARALSARKDGWGYSAVAVAACLAALAAGLAGETALAWTAERLLAPLQSALFASLGFCVAAAAWKGLRPRDAASTLLTVTALAGLLGASWLWLDGPVLGARRGLLLGVALGTLGTCLGTLSGRLQPKPHPEEAS